MITADGCWAEFRTPAAMTHDRPCLFLDRDGVLIEDTGYPHDPATVVLIPETIAAVAAAHRAGFVIGIVSNQSGIGRGFFEWQAFVAVQHVIDAALAAAGARLDFVLACPHHLEATRPEFRADHPWRKPRPGMIVTANKALGLLADRSIMLGDRSSDMEAAAQAGVPHRLLLGMDIAAKSITDAVPILRTHDETHSRLAPSFRGGEAEPGTGEPPPTSPRLPGSGSPLRSARNDGVNPGDVIRFQSQDRSSTQRDVSRSKLQLAIQAVLAR